MVEESGILVQWLDGWQASACHLQCLSKMLSSLITVCVKLSSFKSTASVADMLLEFTCRATGKWKVTVGISSAKNAKLLIWMKCSTSQISWWVLTLWTLTSVCIFSVLLSIYFLSYWQGEFVQQSKLLRLAIISFILVILMFDSRVIF